VDFVILAGYMKLVPCSLVRAYHRAMLNIHPGLLPSFGGQGFYGIRVHRAVIASGARFSGPTVHFVDEEYDRGPILAQAVVPVSPTDTPEMLAARVLKEVGVWPMHNYCNTRLCFINSFKITNCRNISFIHCVLQPYVMDELLGGRTAFQFYGMHLEL